MADRLASRVLLVGWDAADWDIIQPLMDAGEMPHLQALVDRGVLGNIATLDPPFSPMLWTSIATGKTADKHGIIHFTQPKESGGVTPVLSTTRTTKAIWNMLSQEGLRSVVVGWWPSHPAEPIRGAMVSNFYHQTARPAFLPQTLLPGTVHPPELAERLAELRVHESELTAAHLLPFIPSLGSFDQTEDIRVERLARLIAHAASVQSAATYLLETEEWDFGAVYFDAIDHISHGYINYHPPAVPTAPPELAERYGEVVRQAYRWHDEMLGRLVQLAGDDATVIVVSDHGFESGTGRPLELPDVPAGPSEGHRDFGVLVAAGPGVAQDERVYGASLLHVTPTILSLFGLPVGQDMDAPPLAGVFAEPPELDLIPSWDDRPGDAGLHGADAIENPYGAREALQQLIELGYIDEPTGEPAEQAQASAHEAALNLARVYLSTGRPTEAATELEPVYAEAEAHRSLYGLWLAHAYLALGRHDDALTLVDQLRDQPQVGRAALAVLEADVLLRSGRTEDALATLEAVPPEIAHHRDIRLRQAQALATLGQYDAAEAGFRGLVEVVPDHARAWHGLAKVHLAKNEPGDAMDAALAALQRLYFYPEAHYHLGVAMLRLGWAERAAEAFRVAVQQRPRFKPAHKMLAYVYSEYLEEPAAARRHADLYAALGGTDIKRRE